jgi:hypothetical protein
MMANLEFLNKRLQKGDVYYVPNEAKLWLTYTCIHTSTIGAITEFSLVEHASCLKLNIIGAYTVSYLKYCGIDECVFLGFQLK